MYKSGTIDLPLHYGSCPRWLFDKMKRLSRAIIECIVLEKGPEAFLERLADPYFFQSLGCVLAFDWHSSGLTTTVCGAIKEALRGTEPDLGIYIAGGKGRTSRKTPEEISRICDAIACHPAGLIYASRMSAKVDSSCVQDGYDLYQHTFFFNRAGVWSVIQQGMNLKTRYARRYHWFSQKIEDFVCEPHSAVCCDERHPSLNMVAKESRDCRITCTEISKMNPEITAGEIKRLKRARFPQRHQILIEDINTERLNKVLLKTYQRNPEDFESLVITEGVGPKTIRALSLISELIYKKSPSFRDPVRFSYAHGGKDGYPYPVDRKTYRSSTEILEKAVKSARIGRTERLKALKRLGTEQNFENQNQSNF